MKYILAIAAVLVMFGCSREYKYSYSMTDKLYDPEYLSREIKKANGELVTIFPYFVTPDSVNYVYVVKR